VASKLVAVASFWWGDNDAEIESKGPRATPESMTASGAIQKE